MTFGSHGAVFFFPYFFPLQYRGAEISLMLLRFKNYFFVDMVCGTIMKQQLLWLLIAVTILLGGSVWFFNVYYRDIVTWDRTSTDHLRYRMKEEMIAWQRNLTILHKVVKENHYRSAFIFMIKDAQKKVFPHWISLLLNFSILPIVIEANSHDYLYHHLVFHPEQQTYVVSMKDEDTFSHGFQGSCKLVKFPPVITWDKALFFFSEFAPPFEHMTIMEEDVLVTSLASFLEVHQFQSTTNSTQGDIDLLSPPIQLSTNKTKNNHK